jgi:predicted ATP-grasp superfamily ATP-dependent carboligase
MNRISPPAILLGGEATAVSVARSLGRAGVPVWALGRRSDPVRRSRHCLRFVELGDDDMQARWLEWLRGAPAGAVVLPCEDDGLELVARHRSVLVACGLVPVEADDAVLLAMLDKERTYALAGKARIPVPRTATVGDREGLLATAQQVGYPCALKPLHTHLFRRHFRAKGFVAHDRRDLEALFERTHALGIDVMVTELIPGPDDRYWSFYTYLDSDREPQFVFTNRKLRQYPIRYGSGSYHVTDWSSEVAELGVRFCRSVALRGLANVEFKSDPRDGELKLIECNQRFTGPNELLIASGLDLPLFTYNRLIGRDVPQFGSYRNGVALWRPLDDFRAFRAYRRSGELSFADWARSLLRPQRFQLASSADPMPVIVASGHRLGNAVRKLGRLVTGR